MGWPQIHARQRLDQRVGFKFRQLIVLDLTHIAVRLHDVGDRPVDQVLAVHIEGYVVFPVQLANQGNHAFGQGFTLFPVLEKVVGLRSCHVRSPFLRLRFRWREPGRPVLS